MNKIMFYSLHFYPHLTCCSFLSFLLSLSSFKCLSSLSPSLDPHLSHLQSRGGSLKNGPLFKVCFGEGWQRLHSFNKKGLPTISQINPGQIIFMLIAAIALFLKRELVTLHNSLLYCSVLYIIGHLSSLASASKCH